MSEKLRVVHAADYVTSSMGYQELALAKWNAQLGHQVFSVTSDRYSPVPYYKRTWETFLGPRIDRPKRRPN